MHGNVELLAMIFIDSKMVLMPRGQVVSIDIWKYFTYLAIWVCRVDTPPLRKQFFAERPSSLAWEFSQCDKKSKEQWHLLTDFEKVTHFFCTSVGINVIVILNKYCGNISSMIHINMPARGLIKVKISGCTINKDEKELTSWSASPIALVDA